MAQLPLDNQVAALSAAAVVSGMGTEARVNEQLQQVPQKRGEWLLGWLGG